VDHALKIASPKKTEEASDRQNCVIALSSLRGISSKTAVFNLRTLLIEA
jgi:hypothetical protein